LVWKGILFADWRFRYKPISRRIGEPRLAPIVRYWEVLISGKRSSFL
jgi:hypothetical protein